MRIVVLTMTLLAMAFAPYFTGSGIQDKGAESHGQYRAVKEASDIPPSVAIATAGMGPFRGYLLAILWTRVVDLELNEEYSESYEIARWIARLQPRYATIWKYQATQLSVNLPALFPDKEDKWVKIKQGIDLLREEGIVKNPKSHQLYDYLGWIYFNRIGQAVDANHEFYGAKIAHEMQSILGRRLMDVRYGEKVLLDQFDAVINAQPFESSENNEYVKLIEKLDEYEMSLNGDFLRMWNRFEIYIRSAGFLTASKKDGEVEIPEVNNDLCRWLRDNPEITRYISIEVLPYLQKSELKKFNMNPVIMKQMIIDYGPLDWRHPNVLALYWTRMALQVLGELNDGQMVHSITTARMEYIYLLGMIRNGRVHYDPWNNTCQWLPEPRFIGPCAEALERIRQRVARGELRTDQNWVYKEEDLFKAYYGFMDTAIMTTTMYSDDSKDKVEEYFKSLKEKVLKRNGRLPPEMLGTSDDYILTRINKFIGTRKENMNQFVGAMVRRGLWEGLALGKVRTFGRHISKAQMVFEAEKSINPGKYLETNFKTLVLKSCIDEFKSDTVPLANKIIAWGILDADMKIAITPHLISYFNELSEKHGLDVRSAFQVKKINANNKASSS